MMIPAIVTLLFILTIRFVGAYFISKEDQKWEDALMRHFEGMIKEAQANEANAKADGCVVSADAKPIQEVL